MEMYDSIIIGTGPAGISAALNLKIHEKKFLLIGSRTLSDKIAKAEQILNYPGIARADGKTLQEAFLNQINDMGIEITEGMVTAIYPMGSYYSVAVGQDFYNTKTLLLTTGIAMRNTIPGETEHLGRGISYCATCDGPLYKGKTVAVLCTNRRFEHEVEYLAGVAEKVYFIPAYRDPGVNAENVETLSGRVTKVEGDPRVSEITLADGTVLAVDCLFCLRDAIALNSLLPKLAVEDGHIAVDRTMATNLPGCFAAGDCTGRPYQYTKAVGEGNVAAHSILELV